MTVVNSAFTVNGSLPTDAVAVAASSLVTLQIQNTTGINGVVWSIAGNDNSARVNPVITATGNVGATATFTMPASAGDGLGQSYRIQCKASDGGSPPNISTTSAVIGVVNQTAVVPVAAGEELDRNLTYGWTMPFNRALAGPDTVAHGGLQPSDGIHGSVSWLYGSAPERRASTHTSADLWHDAAQTDTSPPTIWKIIAVTSGVATWTRIDTGAEVTFTGDFGALFTGYSGLTVRAYRRGDLGVTGTTGTGKSAWANQLGDGSSMGVGAANSSNGIGSVGALNGKATLVLDGSTQCGLYTFPTSVVPATANQHLYRVQMMLTTAGGYVAASTSGPYLIKTGATGDQQIGNGSGGATSSGEAINNWHRMRCSWIGGLDVIRVGSHEPTPVSTSNNGPGTSWGFGANVSGASLTSFAVALDLHITGPIATFLTAAADADSKLATFWAGATAIEI